MNRCIQLYTHILQFISPRKRSEALRSSVCNSLPNLPKYYAGDGKWLFNIQLRTSFPVLNTLTMWIGGPFLMQKPSKTAVETFCLYVSMSFYPSPNTLHFFLLGSAVCIVHWLMRTSTMFDIIRLLCASAFTESHRKKALAKQQSLVSSSGMS